MKISTRGRYALRVLIDLAEHVSDEFTPMKAVAERQGISLKYLEQIIPVLTKNHFVKGVHGKGGGYHLTRDPALISVGEVLRLTEGDLSPVACLDCTNGSCNCERQSICRTLPMWQELNRIVNNYLNNVTIVQLMANHPDRSRFCLNDDSCL